MSKSKKSPSKPMVQEVFALAREMGWTHLNEQEKKLIDLLRFTTYEGRNIVIHTASAIRAAHPWRDGLHFMNSNTETTYPANDRRFFHPLKES